MHYFPLPTSLPPPLQPLHLNQDSFHNRFFKKFDIQDPFDRHYTICDDIFHNNQRVAILDYRAHSPHLCQNVLDSTPPPTQTSSPTATSPT